MTRRQKNDLCRKIGALHGYCKRRFNADSGHWECVECHALALPNYQPSNQQEPYDNRDSEPDVTDS